MADTNEVRVGGIWFCKIGEHSPLQRGADSPMRDAVAAEYKKLTGQEPAFIFSGWSGELTEPERAVVENRLPVREATPPADAALANDAIIELVTDYAQSKVRAESCRYRYESKEYDKEAADTLEQIRAALRARSVPEGFVMVRDVGEMSVAGMSPYDDAYYDGWNACRSAMLAASREEK